MEFKTILVILEDQVKQTLLLTVMTTMIIHKFFQLAVNVLLLQLTILTQLYQ